MQLDVQRERLRLMGTVGPGARQTVLPVATCRQTMGRGPFLQQTLVDTRLLPVPRLEMRAEYAEVDQREFTPHQAWQQGCETFARKRYRGLPDAAQNRRFHQLEGYRRRYVENFPLVLRVFQQITVIRVEALLLFAAQDQHRGTRDDQRPQCLQLLVLQRCDGVTGLDRRQDGKGIALGVMQQRGAGHRQVGNAPGVYQVAEIDHALNVPMPLGVALPDHVVVGDVHVHRLPRQMIGQGTQVFLNLLGHLLQCCAVGQVFQAGQQMGDQLPGVARVPLQGALEARVRKRGQRLAHAPAQLTKARDNLASQVGQMGQGLLVDIIQQPDMQGLTVDADRQQLFTVQGLDHPGHTQIRPSLQLIQGRVLSLQLHGGVVAPADFQHKSTPRAVDFVVEVLLAAQ